MKNSAGKRQSKVLSLGLLILCILLAVSATAQECLWFEGWESAPLQENPSNALLSADAGPWFVSDGLAQIVEGKALKTLFTFPGHVVMNPPQVYYSTIYSTTNSIPIADGIRFSGNNENSFEGTMGSLYGFTGAMIVLRSGIFEMRYINLAFIDYYTYSLDEWKWLFGEHLWDFQIDNYWNRNIYDDFVLKYGDAFTVTLRYIDSITLETQIMVMYKDYIPGIPFTTANFNLSTMWDNLCFYNYSLPPPTITSIDTKMVGPQSLGVGVKVKYPPDAKSAKRFINISSEINGKTVTQTFDVTKRTTSCQEECTIGLDINGHIFSDKALKVNLADNKVPRFTDNTSFTVRATASYEGGTESTEAKKVVDVFLPVVVLHGYIAQFPLLIIPIPVIPAAIPGGSNQASNLV